MTSIRLVLLDLDGTVYRGSEVIPGAAEAVQDLLAMGLAVRYLTNNSGGRPVGIAAKLRAMGVAAEPEWVIGTGPAAARLAAASGYRRALVIGEPGLHESVEEAGLVWHPQPDVVIAGICRQFTYGDVRAAANAIRQGAAFIATNRDATYPREGGREEPGAGAAVIAIETASGVEPLVVGKPEPALAELAMRSCEFWPGQTIVVGDRYDTDIACGLAAGCSTWMVLTGVAEELPIGQRGSEDLRGLVDELAKD